MKTLISLACISALLLLMGCGQKGDLYHTEDAPPPNMEKATTE